MKTLKLFSLVLGLGLFLVPAFAQNASVRVSVPFDFCVGDQILPAGDYRATINYDSVLQLTHVDGSVVATALTMHVRNEKHQDLRPRLIFHRYGSRRFLSEFWIGDVEIGHELFASSAELNYSRGKQQDHVVLLAMR